MQRSILESYINLGLTQREIALKENVGQSTIRYWLKRFGLKTQWKRGGWNIDNKIPKRGNPCGGKISTEWDWKKIQEKHNNGSSWRDLCKEFGLNISALSKAQKNGLFVARKKNEAMKLLHKNGTYDYSVYRTEEFRKKASKNGGYKEGSGCGRGGWVENIEKQKYYLQSSYEIRMAKILNDMLVLWERPQGIVYVLNNIKHRYYGDFYLPDFKIYIDTKNDYLIKIDKEKIEAVKQQNGIILIVVSKNQISKEFILTLFKNDAMIPKEGKGSAKAL